MSADTNPLDLLDPHNPAAIVEWVDECGGWELAAALLTDAFKDKLAESDNVAQTALYYGEKLDDLNAVLGEYSGGSLDEEVT